MTGADAVGGVVTGGEQMRVSSNGLELEYETTGDPADPPLVLVNGFTSQLTVWQDGFCDLLAAEGLYVIRFDNRDCGLSTHLEGEPDLVALLGGDASSIVYTLDEMADDVVGLLDALGIHSAHVMGVSMGGMIVQLVTIAHPTRVRSLCSIMSSAGDPTHLVPDPDAAAALMQTTPLDREQAGRQAVVSARLNVAPEYLDEAAIAADAMSDYDRAHDPAGDLRQVAAIAVATDRSPQLADVRVPTLVIHGAIDQMIVPAGGEATARAVPGAQLMLVDRMGHYLPEPLWPELVAAIAANARRADAPAAPVVATERG